MIVSESLSTEIRSGCPEGLLYTDDLALVSETLEGLKRRLEDWKGASESKGLRANVKTKMIISSKNARFQKKKSFLKLSVRKDVVNKSILYQFYRCGVHKRCSGIRAKFEKGQQI